MIWMTDELAECNSDPDMLRSSTVKIYHSFLTEDKQSEFSESLHFTKFGYFSVWTL